jgi:hypothetical protein
VVVGLLATLLEIFEEADCIAAGAIGKISVDERELLVLDRPCERTCGVAATGVQGVRAGAGLRDDVRRGDRCQNGAALQKLQLVAAIQRRQIMAEVGELAVVAGRQLEQLCTFKTLSPMAV